MKKKTFILLLTASVLLLSGRDLSEILPSIYIPGQSPAKKMVLIPAGEFLMGSASHRANERPVHRVAVSAFYMDETPVTYEEYTHFIRAGKEEPPYWKYPSYNIPDNPVTGITWLDAACFCSWRSSLEGLEPVYTHSGKYDAWGYPVLKTDFSANGYRLPTEAEFERAARGGLKQKDFPWGNIFDPEKANFDEGRGVIKGKWWRLSRVKDQWQNGFGLFGMSGNIWEWTNDWYGHSYYANSPEKNPRGPEQGSTKSIRGGSWGCFFPAHLRTARRAYSAPGNYNYDIGFRCVRPSSYFKIKQKPGKWNISNCSFVPKQGEQLELLFDMNFRKRLARYLAGFCSESVYFHFPVDGQKKLTPRQMADLIVDTCLNHRINPLFLTGIMKSESGFGTVSFSRWFNNPMAYHWSNFKMDRGLPGYNAGRSRNKKYKNLKAAFEVFCKGIRRPIYLHASRGDLYHFHYIYVGYDALEWMNILSTVYRDIMGVRIDAHSPKQNIGKYIYLDWEKLFKKSSH
ncbi:MAG: formylglycine-generating enzyme family protein [bacterium]|nr:formylglycine-generating enzyme family protein [bacterium]